MNIKFIIFILFGFFQTLSFGQSLEEADQMIRENNLVAGVQILNDLIQNSGDSIKKESYYRLSYAYVKQKSWQKATLYNDSSFVLNQQFSDGGIAKNYMRYGAIYLHQADYENAQAHFFKALDHPPVDEHFTGILKGYIGTTFRAVKNFEKADFYLEESKNIFEKNNKKDDLITTYIHLTKLNISRGKLLAADLYLRQAIETEASLETPNSLQKARIYTVSSTLDRLNEDYESSFINLHRALKIYQNQFGEHHVDVARTYSNLAVLYHRLDEIDTAKIFIQKSLISLCPGFSSPESRENPDLESGVIDFPELLRGYKLKSKILLKEFLLLDDRGKLDEAIHAAEKGLKVLYHLQLVYPEEVTKLRFYKKNYDIFNELIAAWSYKGNMEKAFEYSELAKSATLQNMAHYSNIIKHSNVSAQTKEHLLFNKKMYQGYEENLAKNPADSDLLSATLNHRNQFQKQINLLEKQYPKLNELLYKKPDFNLKEIQNKIGEESILISYFLGEKEYFIFLLDRENFKGIRIPHDSLIQGKDKAWLRAVSVIQDITETEDESDEGIYTQINYISSQQAFGNSVQSCTRSIRKLDKRRFTKNSYVLYLKLIFPIEKYLKKKRHLIIIPHDHLHFLPFETLIKKPGENQSYQKMNFLIKDFAISYHYSAALFQSKLNKKPTYTMDFAGFAPVFNQSDSTNELNNSYHFLFDTTFQNDIGVRSAVDQPFHFKALPHSKKEVEGIARLFVEKGESSRTFLNETATETQFKNVTQARIIHLATHSFINENHPQYSAIAFSPKNIKPGDGMVFSRETYAWEGQPELLVLSSCESGLGKLVQGEGPLALTRGFLYGGTKNILFSLWKVYDKHTQTLMEAFYKNHLNGTSYAYALQEAKLHFLENSTTAHPKKWAGFVLIGQ